MHRLDDDGLLAELRRLSGIDERVIADEDLMWLVHHSSTVDHHAAGSADKFIARFGARPSPR